MARWYLVRHGRTAWNAEGRVQGQTDTPLGEDGLAQALRVARRLASVRFAAVYSSDLHRALATAQAIVGHPVRPEPVQGPEPVEGRTPLPIRTTPLLREANHGFWDGLTYEEARSRDPAEWDRLMRRESDFAAPGGESTRDVLERVTVARDVIAAAHASDDNLLIVAHSGSLRALLVTLLRLPVDASWRLRLDPASVSIIAVHDRAATLDLWNDTSHLEPEGVPI